MGLRLRIFLGMLLVVLLALASTGVVAYFHSQRQDVAYNEQRLQRKEAALSRSLDYVLSRHSNELSGDSIAQIFTDKICELADVHSLVFSLYTLEGSLITTSASLSNENAPPLRLDTESNPAQANPENRFVSVDEESGSEVTKVYWVVENHDSSPLMVASAKYNPRKIDENALGAFLSRLAPVYIILFIGAILIAYFTLQSITSPLLRLKQEMAEADPLSDAPHIEYKWNDVIGDLVSEYNELLENLRASLEERAKYEREGAWKEMAQQVAHEIKNPLTPIRLGIQQLEKAWLDGAPDFEERINKFSSTAIAQIDILAQIAQDFAQLAEVRTPELSKISLEQAVMNSAGMFGPEKVRIEGVNAEVIADMPSLVRLLNNLISNAIEASDEAGAAEPVVVSAEAQEAEVVIAVEDLGVGIAEGELDRIFEPRFTTKNHGLGLGLAMVKSIAEQAGGRVWVKSQEGKGATFYVSLPRGK
jgi:signal transduction histidine kinase